MERPRSVITVLADSRSSQLSALIKAAVSRKGNFRARAEMSSVYEHISSISLFPFLVCTVVVLVVPNVDQTPVCSYVDVDVCFAKIPARSLS
jgi:hypothetical protein